MQISKIHRSKDVCFALARGLEEAKNKKDKKLENMIAGIEKNLEEKCEKFRPYPYFVFLMAMSLIITSIIGIFMSFKYSKNKKIVTVCFLGGVIAPTVLFLLK